LEFSGVLLYIEKKDTKEIVVALEPTTIKTLKVAPTATVATLATDESIGSGVGAGAGGFPWVRFEILDYNIGTLC
jgi:hypothetical protein